MGQGEHGRILHLSPLYRFVQNNISTRYHPTTTRSSNNVVSLNLFNRITIYNGLNTVGYTFKPEIYLHNASKFSSYLSDNTWRLNNRNQFVNAVWKIIAVYIHIYIFSLWRCGPTRAMASPFLSFLDHTQWRIIVGRTPLDAWSVRRRDLYLTTHNTHNRQTSMPPVGFEPTISAGEWP